jgi:hypothetical protein
VRAEHITDLAIALQLLLERYLSSKKIRSDPETMPTGTRDNRSGSSLTTTENDHFIESVPEGGFRYVGRGEEWNANFIKDALHEIVLLWGSDDRGTPHIPRRSYSCHQ